MTVLTPKTFYPYLGGSKPTIIMFTIRLVTIIVHTVIVVCTIIRPPGRGVTLAWAEVLCHLRSGNKC